MENEEMKVLCLRLYLSPFWNIVTVKEVETRVFHTVFEMDREQELAKYEVVVVGGFEEGRENSTSSAGCFLNQN